MFRTTELAVGALLLTASCAPVLRTSLPPHAAPRFFSSAAALERGALDLHLATTPMHNGPLVLYASGAGGWFGAAVDMFKQLAATGCPVAGFSSRAFLKIDRPAHHLISTQQLAGDYRALIGQARAALHLSPTTPVVLTGWSRGAAFAVLVASDLRATEEVTGVIAIGLAEGEDLRSDGPDDESDDGPAPAATGWPFEPYRQLARLTSMPAAVIQASRDNYLPASRARALFGPDTETRRFYTVEARNHRFSGGRPAFERSLAAAMSFVAGRSSRDTADRPAPCS